MSLKWYFYWLCSALGLCHRHPYHAGRGFWSLIYINVFPTYECAFDALRKMLRKLQRAFVLLKQTASSDIQTLTWPPRKHKVKQEKKWPCTRENPLAPLRSFPSQCGVCDVFPQRNLRRFAGICFYQGRLITRDNLQTKSKNNGIDQATQPTVDYIRSDHTQEMLFVMLCSSDQ